mgnify:FL=1
MIFNRIFGYPILEQRLEDKDKEISRLIEENKELRDRLFIKFGLPVLGQEVITSKAAPMDGWKSKKDRLKDFINSKQPLIATLSDEEIKSLSLASQ